MPNDNWENMINPQDMDISHGPGVPDIPFIPPPPQNPQPIQPNQQEQSDMPNIRLGQQISNYQPLGQGQPLGRGRQQSEDDPLVMILEELYKRTNKLEDENKDLRSDISIITLNIKNLQSFVKAVLDFISDKEHFEDLDRFVELLKENWLSPKIPKPVDEDKKSYERKDISNRLDNIG